MTKEIERKWWVRSNIDYIVESVKRMATESMYIEQRYFQEPNDEKAVGRVRQYYTAGERKDRKIIKSEITTKCGFGIERSEHNIPICDDLASDMMCRNMDEYFIQKTRYMIPLQLEVVDLCLEVDVYEGDNQGLVHVEIEFPDRETAENFSAIHWFAQNEVTDDKAHTNAALQERPYFLWKDK